MKIGRYTYDIIVGDKFLDNGSCVQLLSQSKEKVRRGGSKRPSPVLSIKAVQELHSKYTLVSSLYYKGSEAVVYTVTGIKV